MIKQLNIKNFQSHKNTTLEFHPGVNTIVGPTDSGKSAIIRALRWLIWNRPTGEAFRSTWGGETQVRITTDQNQFLRIKDKGNVYALSNDPEGVDWTEYVAFGSDVPEDIQKALNIDETNLQLQLDSPFLLSSSPGEVSAYFNKIAHLDQIDKGVKYAQNKIRTITSQINSDERRVEELSTEIKKYDYIDKFEIEFEIVEQMGQEWQQKITTQNKLESIITNIKNINQRIYQYERTILLEEQVEATLQLYKERETRIQQSEDIYASITNIIYIDHQIETIEKTSKLLPQIDKILSLIAEANEKEEDQENLEKLIHHIAQTEKDVQNTEKEIKSLKSELHKHMPKVCPLCGNKLST